MNFKKIFNVIKVIFKSFLKVKGYELPEGEEEIESPSEPEPVKRDTRSEADHYFSKRKGRSQG